MSTPHIDGWNLMRVHVRLMPEDIHNRITNVELESLRSETKLVRYDLTDGRGKTVLKVLDYRRSAYLGWRAVRTNNDRVAPEMVEEFFNGFASMMYPYANAVEEDPDGSISRPVQRLVTHVEFNHLDEDEEPVGIFTHIAHGLLVRGGEVVKISTNWPRSPEAVVFGDARIHSAVTVVATAEMPAIIEQFPCVGKTVKPPFLFINEQIHEVDASLVAPEDSVLRTAQIQEFLENGIVPS